MDYNFIIQVFEEEHLEFPEGDSDCTGAPVH